MGVGSGDSLASVQLATLFRLAAMEVIILGSGTSQGVPMIACKCAVCTSTDPRNQRTRCSIHVVMDGLHIQVDAAQEFREQCLRHGVDWLDLFLLTHGHADHVAGMDDLRRFCDLLGGNALPIYSTDEGMSRVIAMYPYAIMERPVVRGYPAFKLAELPPVLELEQGTIRSTLLPRNAAAERRLSTTPIANACRPRPARWRRAPRPWCSTDCARNPTRRT